MPDPDIIRFIPLLLFPILFIMGLFRPVFMPISFMVLWLSKLPHYYPELVSIHAEALVGGLGTIRVLLYKNTLMRLGIKYDLINKYFYFFLLSIALSFIFAWSYQHSWDYKLYDFIKVLLFYCMVLGSIRDKNEIKIFIWSLAFLYLYLAYEPLYQFVTGTGGVEEMFGTVYISEVGIFSGHVSLANNMNQIIPIIFFLFLSARKKSIKIIALITLLVFIVVLIMSKSRGGVLGFMMFAGCLTYYSKNRIRNGVLIGIILMLFAISLVSFKATASRIDEGSAQGRLSGLIHGIEMVLKGNLIGVGPGCYRLARSKYFHHTLDSHNIYGQILGDLGIPGAIIWFFLIRQIFINLIKSRRKLKLISMENSFLYHLSMGLQISLFVRLFVCLASHALYIYYWYIVAALSIAILKNVEILLEKHETINKKDVTVVG